MPNEVEITITAQDLSGPAFAGALAHLATLQAAAKMLARDIGKVGAARLDTGAMAASLIALKAKIQQLGIADIADVNVPYGRLITQINIIKRFIDQAGISDLLDVNVDPQKLAAQIQKLKGISETIPINFDVGPLPSNLIGKNLSETVLVNVQGAQQGASALNNLAAAATAAVGASGGAGSGGGGGSGILGAAAAGGYFGNVWGNVTSKLRTGGGGWGMMIGGVGAWHLALDAAIEATIAFGLALAAATAGGLVMAETTKNISQHLQAVDTVAGALGQNIPPLTGKLDALAHAMAPQTIEIYGAGLRLVTQESGLLRQAASPVVTLFDNWAAKILIWAQNQTQFGKLIHSGVGYLSQLGNIVGTVGQIFGNLLHDDPGIAHYLLDIVQAIFDVVKAFTLLPGPIVAGVLALHGMYIWGKVLAAGMIYLGQQTVGLVKSLAGLAANPLVWAAAAAAGMAYLAYESMQADNATKTFIANLNAGLANDKASTAMTQISADIGQIESRMQSQTITQTLQGWSHSWAAIGYDARAAAQDVQSGLKDIFTPSGSVLGGLAKLGDAIKAVFVPGAGASIVVQNNINALNKELQALVGQQGNLFHETGNLITQGYTYAQSVALMDLAGVRASDTYQMMREKVASLITGYKDLGISGSILTNSVNAVTFAALQQNEKVAQLNAGWDAFEQMVVAGETDFFKFNNTIVNLNTTLGKTSGAVDTLGKKQAQQIQYFTMAATQANAEMDSLTTLTNAAGLGAKGTDLLAQATKDMLAAMLPAAAKSQTFTAILYALAQRGGYQGADSFKALSKWVGNVQNPMQNLNKITGILTRASAGLTQDVKNLSMALGTTLNNAMATAIFQASGGQQVFDQFAKSIMTTKFNSEQDRTAALNLATSLQGLTGNTHQTKQEFLSFAQGALHLTQKQADTLWQETFPQLQSTINSLHGKNIPIAAIVSGSGGITMKQQLLGQNASGHLEFHAGGGYVGGSGGATQDNQLIAASPGEFVVNAKSASAIGPHGMAAINSYAQGGIVQNLIHDPLGLFGWYEGKKAESFDDRASVEFESAAVKAFRAAEKRAQKMLITGGNAGANAGAYERYALSLFPSHGWGGIQMTGLVPLWTRESSWNNLAMNPSSGAFGIAQALGHGLPGTAGRYGNQYPSLAANNGNAAAQIQWGEDYIAGTYGTPLNAWAHELSAGWYGDGLNAVVNGPTLIGVGERGKEHVQVTPMDGRGGACRHVVVLDVRNASDDLKAMIRKWVISDGGGDVQEAFGRDW